MRRLLSVVILLGLFILISCSKNPLDEGETNNHGNPTSSDSIASAWFQTLGDTVTSLDDMTKEEIRSLEFTNIRNGFNQALATDPQNPVAHLGLSILEILELNYSQEIWEVIDSLDAWDDSFSGADTMLAAGGAGYHPLIGNQFSLLAKIPFGMALKRSICFPPNVTVTRIQQIIESTIIPALDRSISHLASVEANTNTSVRFYINDEGVTDTVFVDLGEIYFFDASVHASRAGFRMAIAYDYDFPGPDGTYDWIDAIRRLNNEDVWSECPRYQVLNGAAGDTLNLFYYDNHSEAQTESVLVSVAHYNVEDRNDFLTLRNGGSVLQAAHNDLLETIGKLEDSVDFIKNKRSAHTEENVIKLTDLTDLESDLDDPDVPNFAKNFNTVEDVLNWVEGFLSGPVTFTEELGSSHTLYTWTMDISAFFNSPVQDWKGLLPYHRWVLPQGPWTEQSLVWEWGWENNPSWPIEEYVELDGLCQFQTFNNISYEQWQSYEYKLKDLQSFVELLDGPGGNVIDLDTERFPYLPDYTINGLFPGMTRSKWIELVNILD